LPSRIDQAAPTSRVVQSSESVFEFCWKSLGTQSRRPIQVARWNNHYGADSVGLKCENYVFNVSLEFVERNPHTARMLTSPADNPIRVGDVCISSIVIPEIQSRPFNGNTASLKGRK